MRDLLVELFQDLTGQLIPLRDEDALADVQSLFERGLGLGYSQLNESLLQLGYDRIDDSFFQYLVDEEVEYEPGSAIASLAMFREGVDRFRKLAILSFGNVKYAFKRCSIEPDYFLQVLMAREPLTEEHYKSRHEPVRQLKSIRGEDAALLGYVSSTLDRDLAANPEDANLREKVSRRDAARKAGLANQDAYLTSDHMDVYVATSMRAAQEFVMLQKLTSEIFGSGHLKALNVRWFDPTAAYCEDRIDKGLAEALMLKRAKCTLYFVQESDTLGKDSELACTLAQGKPVIAFVPEVNRRFCDDYLEIARRCAPEKSVGQNLLDQLKTFEPEAAWNDPRIRELLGQAESTDDDASFLQERLLGAMKMRYDSRADMLKNKHPLGLQVNLENGVANGVIVVRNVATCVEVLRRTLLGTLEFVIDEANPGYICLRESVTESVFRAVTGNARLTNAFWNFYLDPSTS